MFRRAAALTFLLALAVLTACEEPDELPLPRLSTSDPGAPGPAPENGSPAVSPEPASPAPDPPPGSGDLKEMGKGLYLRDKMPSAEMGFIDHVVVTADWSEFEPRDQEFEGAGWTRLAGTLENPGIKVRLRIQAGRGAPSFVKKVGGESVSGDGVDCSKEGGIAIAKRADTVDGVDKAASRDCVPYFWTDPYLDQYQQLMQEVARRYESHPRLLDVVDSACMTLFAEPFIRAGRSKSTNMRLFEAGLNKSTDEACQRRSLEIHDQSFPSTRVSLATHSVWQIIVDTETSKRGVELSWDEQRSFLEEMRRRYGEKLVVQNNGLGGDEGCRRGDTAGDSHFCWLKEAAAPKGFQTEGDRRLRSRGYTVFDPVEQALDMGACFVEHNQFGTDPRRARSYDERLKQSC